MIVDSLKAWKGGVCNVMMRRAHCLWMGDMVETGDIHTLGDVAVGDGMCMVA